MSLDFKSMDISPNTVDELQNIDLNIGEIAVHSGIGLPVFRNDVRKVEQSQKTKNNQQKWIKTGIFEHLNPNYELDNFETQNLAYDLAISIDRKLKHCRQSGIHEICDHVFKLEIQYMNNVKNQLQITGQQRKVPLRIIFILKPEKRLTVEFVVWINVDKTAFAPRLNFMKGLGPKWKNLMYDYMGGRQLKDKNVFFYDKDKLINQIKKNFNATKEAQDALLEELNKQITFKPSYKMPADNVAPTFQDTIDYGTYTLELLSNFVPKFQHHEPSPLIFATMKEAYFQLYIRAYFRGTEFYKDIKRLLIDSNNQYNNRVPDQLKSLFNPLNYHSDIVFDFGPIIMIPVFDYIERDEYDTTIPPQIQNELYVINYHKKSGDAYFYAKTSNRDIRELPKQNLNQNPNVFYNINQNMMVNKITNTKIVIK